MIASLRVFSSQPLDATKNLPSSPRLKAFTCEADHLGSGLVVLRSGHYSFRMSWQITGSPKCDLKIPFGSFPLFQKNVGALKRVGSHLWGEELHQKLPAALETVRRR